MKYTIALIAVLSLSACSSAPVVRDSVSRPLPVDSMRKTEALPRLNTNSISEFKSWAGEATEKFGMCVTDKSKLIEYILRDHKSEK